MQLDFHTTGLRPFHETAQWVGLLPQMLSSFNCKTASEQLNDGYQRGWRPFGQTEWRHIPKTEGCIQYPGDPVYRPVAYAKLRDETIFVYMYGIVSIFQKDGSFEVARMD